MAGKVISRFQSGSGIHLISSTFYGTCNTAADVAVKQVEINDEHVTELKLIPGMLLSVKFTNGNTATNPQLEIYAKGTTSNPLKSAISITPNTLTWGAGEVILFVYDNSNNNEQWISNYLSVSGGTLTGKLNIQDNNINIATAPSSNQYSSVFEILDSSEKQIMNITDVHEVTGNYHGFSIGTYDSETGQQNTLQLSQNNNSGYKVWISQPAAWRSALSIGTIGTKNTLTASDIPDIPASKITSGTLPIEYGGTGATTAEGARSNLNVVGASDQSRQNARFFNFLGADQIYGLYATCINANNTDFNGKNVGAIFRNGGISLYNGMNQTFPWHISGLSGDVNLDTTAWQTLASGVTYRRHRGWVIVRFDSYSYTASGTEVAVGILSVGYRPNIKIFSAAFATGVTMNMTPYITVSTDGYVRVNGHVSGAKVYGEAVFPV